MLEDAVRVPVDILRQFMNDVFIGVGVPAPDAAICADILIQSDLFGIESHGIGRLKMYYDRLKTGKINAVTNFEIIRQGPATAVVDGHFGMGHVIGYRSMALAIEKARTYGMGSVAVRNSTHFGIDGYYALMAANANMIGMSFCNARPAVTPTFGAQPKLGTNPIAFGAPTDEKYPFLYDAATSTIQRGKVEVLDREEKSTPSGYVIDNNGQFMTDTQKILVGFDNDACSLLPLGGLGEETGGHKGYGLSTMVEILSASLQSGPFLQTLAGVPTPDGIKTGVGQFFMAINIEAFVDLAEFKSTTGKILRELRAARKIPGKDRIYTAGEKEFERQEFIKKAGVPVVPNLQKQIKTIQQELNLNKYNFPF